MKTLDKAILTIIICSFLSITSIIIFDKEPPIIHFEEFVINTGYVVDGELDTLYLVNDSIVNKKFYLKNQ